MERVLPGKMPQPLQAEGNHGENPWRRHVKQSLHLSGDLEWLLSGVDGNSGTAGDLMKDIVVCEKDTCSPSLF